jgi:hypothetical protein
LGELELEFYGARRSIAMGLENGRNSQRFFIDSILALYASLPAALPLLPGHFTTDTFGSLSALIAGL